MRVFANLFVIAFLMDASISVFDEILSATLEIGSLSSIRNIIAYTVVLFAVPMYLILGINRRLPKRLLLPLIIFVFWAAFFSAPVLIYFNSEAVTLSLSLMQLLIGIWAFFYIRKLTAGNWTLTSSSLEGPMFSGRNTVVFCLVNIILVHTIFAIHTYSSLGVYANQQTAGFLRISPSGIYLKEKEYRKGDKVIRLVGMVHIGEDEYYQELSASLSSKKMIILAEGVTDRERLIDNFPSLNKLADFVGLNSQDEMDLQGALIDFEDIDDNRFYDTEENGPVIVRADIDIKDFSPETIDFLNNAGSRIKNGKTPLEALFSYYKWTKTNVSPQTHEIIMDDILTKRNREVLRYMEEALHYYDDVIIPWGAMHMPEIEKSVLDMGFSFAREQERMAINFY